MIYTRRVLIVRTNPPPPNDGPYSKTPVLFFFLGTHFGMEFLELGSGDGCMWGGGSWWRAHGIGEGQDDAGDGDGYG